MKNTCNYSDKWQQYIGDYDKFEYDIVLKDGTLVENCYPNAGKFNSISDEHNEMQFNESDVSFIRFSEKPRFGLNGGVSERPQFEWLDARRNEREANPIYEEDMISAYKDYHSHIWPNIHSMFPPVPKWARGKKVIPVRNSKTDPKIQRNEPCPCGSGQKHKKCCGK